jgi:hypothetical protein
LTWSDDVRAQFDLPPELKRLVEVAEEAEARWLSIKAELDAAGAYTVMGQAGVPKLHPLVAAERAARDAFLRSLKTVNLALEDDN